MKLATKSVVSVAVGVLTLLLATVTPLFDDLEFRVSDLWLQIRGRQAPPPGVVVVAIDEASYRELGVQYGPPWPRLLHAKLLERLKSLGAKRVAFDVLFIGPGADPKADEALTAALAGVPSVIGAEASMRFIQNQGGGYMIEELERPYDPFRKVATEALIGLRERKGIIRNFPLPRSDQERKLPFLAQAAAGMVNSQDSSLPGPYDLIRYYGPGRSLPIFSFWEILSDDAPLPKEQFKDATVFVGLLLRSDTGGSQKDSYVSPFGPPMIFGLEVHATIFSNYAQKSWISRPSPAVERSAQAFIAALAAFVALSLSPVAFAIFTTSLVVVWAGAAFYLIGAGFFLAGAPTVLILVPIILLCSAFHSYLSARRAEESLRSAFSLYVSPEMVPKLQSEGGALKLGGEKLWVTALFTDILDFTSISEDMPAEKTSEMLNAYFTEVVEVVFKNQGTLLKFIGDAIFAIWGAPIKLSNHAELAIQAARDIQAAVERFNAAQRFPRLTTRVGVHTGPMLVGNLGSQKRFDYTAIGDAVNLASRIEGLNKYFGTTILFSEATRKDAGGFSGAVHMGQVRVKGRKEAVSLYSVFDPPLDPAVLAEWNKAVNVFSGGKVTESASLFESIALKDRRLETAAQLYRDEVTSLTKEPLPQGWAGELNFEVK
jgi:adenylate cyclase